MDIIYHITENDLHVLIDRVVSRLHKEPAMQQKWLTPKEAMSRLNLRSKTSLYHLRMKGEISYSQPRKRVILYSASSIEDYLNRNIKEGF